MPDTKMTLSLSISSFFQKQFFYSKWLQCIATKVQTGKQTSTLFLSLYKAVMYLGCSLFLGKERDGRGPIAPMCPFVAFFILPWSAVKCPFVTHCTWPRSLSRAHSFTPNSIFLYLLILSSSVSSQSSPPESKSRLAKPSPKSTGFRLTTQAGIICVQKVKGRKSDKFNSRHKFCQKFAKILVQKNLK